MRPSLVIMAAGKSSRYGSPKQLYPFGPNGETLIEFSIYDAIRTGFGKVILIVNSELISRIQEHLNVRVKDLIEIVYVTQDIKSFVGSFRISSNRIKPWGTAHAVLCAIGEVKGPFSVINADDFYGRDAFRIASIFLKESANRSNYALISYELERVLSVNGPVNRGICRVDSGNNLLSITEHIGLSKGSDGLIYGKLSSDPLPFDTNVSVNFWCFHQSFFDLALQEFKDFLFRNCSSEENELYVPDVVNVFIKLGGKVNVLHTNSAWFGVTYKEDAPFVQESLENLINAGEYPNKLWN